MEDCRSQRPPDAVQDCQDFYPRTFILGLERPRSDFSHVAAVVSFSVTSAPRGLPASDLHQLLLVKVTKPLHLGFDRHYFHIGGGVIPSSYLLDLGFRENQAHCCEAMRDGKGVGSLFPRSLYPPPSFPLSFPPAPAVPAAPAPTAAIAKTMTSALSSPYSARPLRSWAARHDVASASPDGTKTFVAQLNRGAVQYERLSSVVILRHFRGAKSSDAHLCANGELLRHEVNCNCRPQVDV